MEGEKEGEESRLQWSLSGTVLDKALILCGRDGNVRFTAVLENGVALVA